MNRQVNNALQHIFLFLLFLAVGLVLSQQNAIQLDHNGSLQLDSMTPCQQITIGNISNPFSDVSPLFDKASETNAQNTQTKTISSCNSLLNMLPADNRFFFSSGEQPVNIGSYNAVLSSQTFVFQEPDPPRIG